MLDELTEPDTTTVMDNGETILVKFNKTGRGYEIDGKGNIGEPILDPNLLVCRNHIYGEDWVIDTEPTCLVEGSKHTICIACGTKVIEKIATIEHNYVNTKCTMCGAMEPVTAAEMQSNLASYLGQTVNYGVTYKDANGNEKNEWVIFYADENNIYLISKGNLESAALSVDGYNGTDDFTAVNSESKYPAVKAGLLEKTYDPTSVGSELKYSSNRNNMKATSYLLDSTVWSTYAPESNNFADWAIGGPTLELFVKSYNAYYGTTITINTPTGYGYKYDDELYTYDSVPTGTYLQSGDYWLACPSSYNFGIMRAVNSSRDNIHTLAFNNSTPFRPVVRLKSTVSIVWNETKEEYDLVIPTM